MELDVSKGFLKPDEAFPFEAEVVLPPQEVNGETVFFLTIIFIFSVISASAAHYSIIAHIIALFKKPGSLPRQNFPERCTTTAHKQYIIGSPVKQRPAAGRHHYRTILQSILVFN